MRVAQAAKACSWCAAWPHNGSGWRSARERRRAAAPPTSAAGKAALALAALRDDRPLVGGRESTLAWPRCSRLRCPLGSRHGTRVGRLGGRCAAAASFGVDVAGIFESGVDARRDCPQLA